jgi:hypothetical protein
MAAVAQAVNAIDPYTWKAPDSLQQTMTHALFWSCGSVGGCGHIMVSLEPLR